jgi:pyruvate/2-oxoglutarate dehydrogenase complex dihydrolipoamide dehydrogenase (E3) component
VKSYDLIVIGAGPAGEKGAAQAAYFGKKVAIVEPSARPGGIAMSNAGIPTKALREGAIYLSGLGQSAFAAPPPGGTDFWSHLKARKVEVADFLMKGVERNLTRHGIARHAGRARLLPGRRVEVTRADGTAELLEARIVLIACGSRPRRLTPRPSSRWTARPARCWSWETARRAASTRRSSRPSGRGSRWSAPETTSCRLSTTRPRGSSPSASTVSESG